MLKKILVPLDGSDPAERALTYATALATPTGAQLVLLRAAPSHARVGVDSRGDIYAGLTQDRGVDKFVRTG